MASLLLISPKTYQYHERLCQAAKNLDLNLVWLDERPSSNLVVKIMSRQFNLFSRFFFSFYFKRKLLSISLSGFTPSHVLVVKGECLHQSVIKYISILYPKAKLILYLWDSLPNLPGCLTIEKYFDSVYSFDPYDCAQYGWLYRPLFASNKSYDNDLVMNSYCWSFVGVLHSDRLIVLRKLMSNIRSNNFYLYLYIPSLLHLALIFIKNPISSLSLYPYFRFSPLNYINLEKVYRSSEVVIDIHHPNQSGLTIRSIETVLSGRKLVTTNITVKDEKFYDSSRVLCINRDLPFILPSFFKTPFLPVPASISDYYTTQFLLSEILSL